MIPLELLKVPWIVFGLNAPAFLWIAATGLVLFTSSCLLWLWAVIHRERRLHATIRSTLGSIKAQYPRKANDGLSAAAYDAVVRLFENMPAYGQAWHAFNALILAHRNPAGDDQFWATESAEQSFGESVVIDTRLNRRFFQAVPGLVTGLGLLFTFLAILVALLDLAVDPQTKLVNGIELLISGLSGKFVSSIAALFAATVYLLLDSRLLHRLSRSRLALVASLDSLIPRLSTARLLADLHHDLSEQSIAFRQFNADLSLKLRQGFSESIGPTIQRMVDAIDQLNGFLVQAEADKQDSITAEVRNLLQSMQQSISHTLETMGSRFTESLSGTAMGEFNRVAGSLGDSAKVLETMNANFQAAQSQLSELVNYARSTTAEQLALGKSQVEDLTSVMRALMVQLNETTGASVATMTSALTSVVQDLSDRVSDLSAKMSQAVQESAETASGAASKVIHDAESWSERSAQQLAQLIEKHQDHVASIKDVRTELDRALSRFKESLTQHSAITTDLRKIASEVSAFMIAAGGITTTLKETQKSFQEAAGVVASHAEKLGEANRQQGEMWRQVQASMNEYRQVFAHVGREAGALLSEIAKHIENMTLLSQQHLSGLIETSNNHFTAATSSLGASVEELKEHLADLNETVEKLNETLSKRRPEA